MNDDTPPLSCHEQITLSKIDKFCQWAIPKQISTISMHTSNLVKIHLDLPSYCPESKIQMCCVQITLSKIDEILPLAIPKQMPIISMLEQTDEHLDGHMDSQHDTMIPCHYRVVGYKKGIFIIAPEKKLFSPKKYLYPTKINVVGTHKNSDKYRQQMISWKNNEKIQIPFGCTIITLSIGTDRQEQTV